MRRMRREISWPASALQDLRHGAILLWRDASVSSLIVLVLAMGIGGSAAIFTLWKAAFLDPLPYRDAGRLITITAIAGEIGTPPSIPEFLQVRARSHMLKEIALVEYHDMQLAGRDGPARVFAASVTASFFPLLGVNASLGRTFLEEDNEPGRTSAILVTDAFWRARMGADPGAVGRILRLDDKPAVVVGVLPQSLHFDYPTLHIPEPPDIYVAYPVDRSAPVGRDWRAERVVLARLPAGVRQARAQSELDSIGEALARDYPEAYRTRWGKAGHLTFKALPLRDAIVGTERSLLWLLLGGVAVVLVIACANTAQLLLVRSLRRGQEVAVRAALGATRFRLIRQFLLEGFVLAACGGLVGLLFSGWVVRLLIAVLPVRNPVLFAAHLDARVTGFTLAVSLISAAVFATVPAWKGSHWTPGQALKARANTREGNRWRHALMAVEAALSVFLLCGAGLVAQNLWGLISTPMGFDPNHVLALRLKEPPNGSGAPFQEYLAKTAAIPGVDSAATVTGPPLRPSVSGPVELVGVLDRAGALKSVIGDNHLVSRDYFRTLRIPLLAGRLFRDGDETEPWRVVIVNEEFARCFGLGRDVVGKQIFEPGRPMTIIGMVGNVRTRGLQTAPFPEVYLSSLRFSWTNQYLVVRSALPPAQLFRLVQAALQSANADQAVFGVQTMDELLADSVTEPRFDVFLIGAFALVALAMAATGMYSVVSFLVSQRTSEIAIRRALGAARGDIVRTVLGTTSLWVVAGLTGGLALGLATSRTLRSLTDTEAAGSPGMYAAVVLFFLAVTIVAASAPVRRALRLDPAAALRWE